MLPRFLPTAAGCACAVVLVLAGLGLTGISPSLAEPVTIRADAWCPLNCDPSSDHPGYGIEIAKAIFEPAGHPIDYRLMPWARALVEVKQGRILGAIGADPDEDPELIYPNSAIGMADTGFAVRAGTDFQYTGIDSLQPMRIGAVRDYAYDGGEIDAYLQANSDQHAKVQLLTGNDVIEKNLAKLMAERVDVVIDSPFVLRYEIARLGLTAEVRVVPLGDPSPIFIAFSPADPDGQALADLFDSGLAALRAHGQLAPILERYNLTDWQE